jgi:predicted RNase H-like nuclease (RuvC/YqgF family)
MKKTISSSFALLIAAGLCLPASATPADTKQATAVPPPQSQAAATTIANQMKQIRIEITRDDERIRTLNTLIARENHDAAELRKAAALIASDASAAAALKKDADTHTQQGQTYQNEVNDLEPKVQKLRDQLKSLEQLLKQ